VARRAGPAGAKPDALYWPMGAARVVGFCIDINAICVYTHQMARPRKPSEEKYVVKSIRFPPALWAELAEEIPAGERSAFIHEEIARALRRLRRQKASSDASGRTASAPSEEEPITQPTIWEKIDALIDRVPEEAFATLPEDGSEQHDHYIYGLPKRPR
jgi:hypothetical protein